MAAANVWTVVGNNHHYPKRTAAAAALVGRNEVVLDLGCGHMDLKHELPEGCTYIPCDICARSPDTIVCDFNINELPNVVADIVVVLGVLEYLTDPVGFARSLTRYKVPVVISYHPKETGVNCQTWAPLCRGSELECALPGYKVWVKSLEQGEMLYYFKLEGP